MSVVAVLAASVIATAAAAATAPRKKPATPACDRATFKVVLDVGHSVEVPGAISARGVPEYDFNLKLGQQVEKAMTDAGFAKTVLLITAGQAQPSLAERVRRANALGADLFLSIHHDSVPDIFKLKWDYEGKPNSYSDRFKGHSIFISADNPDYAGSLAFAKTLGLQLKARGLQYTPHYIEAFMGNRRRLLMDAEAGIYRYDQLIVLRATRMPAVLLEAGSIINRDEELLMTRPEHQALIGASVVDAVQAFCAARSPAKAIQPASQKR